MNMKFNTNLKYVCTYLLSVADKSLALLIQAVSTAHPLGDKPLLTLLYVQHVQSSWLADRSGATHTASLFLETGRKQNHLEKERGWH